MNHRLVLFLALGLLGAPLGTVPLQGQPTRPSVPPSDEAVAQLEAWLRGPRAERGLLTNSAFALSPLKRADARRAAALLWKDHAAWIRAARTAEMAAGAIELDGRRLRFETLSFGDTNHLPSGGRSLFLSLHGGGNARPSVNDSQWRNQLRLGRDYAPAEGIYLAPRAPTDTWNLWHEAHIDPLFDRLIENLIVLEQINPDRVYVMGYSAGGDGVYQLGPRMADRWAAAAMMAGHPNETSPLGLRNVPFALQAGALDSAYKRNEVTAEWGRKLDDLQRADPDGYVHFTEIHAGKPHWMNLEDKKAVPWMEKFTRNPFPRRVVWRQDDVTHDRFYWLALPPGTARQGQEVLAERNGSTFSVRAKDVTRLLIRLNDEMTDLDQPITIKNGERILFSGRLSRTIAALAKTLEERGDPRLVFSTETAVDF